MAMSPAMGAADSPATYDAKPSTAEIPGIAEPAGRPIVRTAIWGIFLMFARIVANNLTEGRLARHVTALAIGGAGCVASLAAIGVSWRLGRNTRDLTSRVAEFERDLRQFLHDADRRDPVYGPNSWKPPKQVAEDPSREMEWRARRDDAYWEHQRNLRHEYSERFMARVLVLMQEIPAHLASKLSDLPRDRFARPRHDRDMQEVLEYVAVAAERLRRA